MHGRVLAVLLPLGTRGLEVLHIPPQTHTYHTSIEIFTWIITDFHVLSCVVGEFSEHGSH